MCNWNYQKCARVYSKGGKVTSPQGNRFEEIRVLQAGDSYKYLGVEQLLGTLEEVVKFRLWQEFLQQLKWVWGSELSGRQKVEVTNLWAISQYTYYLPLIQWQVRDLSELDRLVRRVMLGCKSHYYGSSVKRCNLPRSEGGRGVMSVVDSYEMALLRVTAYLEKPPSNDVMMRAVLRHQLHVYEGGGWIAVEGGSASRTTTELGQTPQE